MASVRDIVHDGTMTLDQIVDIATDMTSPEPAERDAVRAAIASAYRARGWDPRRLAALSEAEVCDALRAGMASHAPRVEFKGEQVSPRGHARIPGAPWGL